MCITYDRKPRGVKYIVEGEVKVGRADHHDYVLPRSIVCILSIIGTFLFIAGAILLMVGHSINPMVLLPWGGVICGIGFLLCFIAILLCLHAYCIIPVDGYKVTSLPEKKNIVVVRRMESSDDERFANKRVFASGGSAGESGTLTSTQGRSGYISSSHSELNAHRYGATATGSEAHGSMETQQSGTRVVIQPTAAAHSETQVSTSRSVNVIDGSISVSNEGHGVGRGATDAVVTPTPGAKQAVYVQVLPQSASAGQQAQRIQSHAQTVEYVQVQAQGQQSHSPVPQEEAIVTANFQRQQSAPVGQFRDHTQSQGEFSAAGGQHEQYSYSTTTHQESASGGQQQSSATRGALIPTGGGGFTAIAGQPGAPGQQTSYYSETTTTKSTTYDEGAATSNGLLVPSHFQCEATPDMRHMRRDMSNMSNVSNMSGFSRPDSFGIERDEDFQYYQVDGVDQQQQQQQQNQNQSYGYQYQYSVEAPQVHTQSQTSSATYSQGHSSVHHKGERKGSLYENTQMR